MGMTISDWFLNNTADICVSCIIILCFVFTVLYRIHVKRESEIFATDDNLSASPLFDDAANAGDDVGDAFLREVGHARVHSSLGSNTSLLDVAADTGPAGKKFLKEFTEVPDWVDMDLVQRGQAFQRQWVEVIFSTGLASLIESYGYSNGAQILVETGRLACCGEAHKRALETATFNLDLFEHGVGPGQAGQDRVARVRVLHCMVRQHVQSACPWWDAHTMGVPVSQEDGAHTVFHNSHTALCGMQNLGLPVCARDMDAVSMFWAYVGYMLGVSAAYLPRSYREERHLHNMVFNKLFRPNAVTQRLISATLECVLRAPPHHLDRLQNITLARLTLGSRLSSQLLTAPEHADSDRWMDFLFVQLLRVRTFGRYLLYEYLGVRNRDFEAMRRVVSQGLREYPGAGNWRFYLANKNEKNGWKKEL